MLDPNEKADKKRETQLTLWEIPADTAPKKKWLDQPGAFDFVTAGLLLLIAGDGWVEHQGSRIVYALIMSGVYILIGFVHRRQARKRKMKL